MKKTILSIIYSIFLISGCKDTVTGDAIDKIVIPDSQVSFSKYILPVFNLKCNNSGCHDDKSKAGSLSLTSWSNVVIPGVVNAGDTLTSRLIWAIEGQLGASPMPPLGYVPLTSNQIKGIKTWVKEGAKNN